MTDREWFEDWFGEEYLELYPHRDDREAAALVTLLHTALPWQPGWSVLDVGAGAGRHARALEAAGARPIGVDLSAALLRRAREVTVAPLVRADMRALPIRAASMDLTVNLFTSFGYFAEDHEHADALRDMTETVRPGGWFVIDYLNEAAVRRSLVPEETASLGQRAVTIRRWITPDERFVCKEFTVSDGGRFLERVRLFDASDLKAMLAPTVDVTACFGGYDGKALDADATRVILMGQRR